MESGSARDLLCRSALALVRLGPLPETLAAIVLDRLGMGGGGGTVWLKWPRGEESYLSYLLLNLFTLFSESLDNWSEEYMSA